MLNLDADGILLGSVERVGKKWNIQLEFTFMDIFWCDINLQSIICLIGLKEIYRIHDVEVLLNEPIAIADLHRGLPFYIVTRWVKSFLVYAYSIFICTWYSFLYLDFY